ncbi:hypothetical protein GCM10009630_15400 [Kribbella jejuensis]
MPIEFGTLRWNNNTIAVSTARTAITQPRRHMPPVFFRRRALERVGGRERAATAVWRSDMQRLLRTAGPDQSPSPVSVADFIRTDDRSGPE